MKNKMKVKEQQTNLVRSKYFYCVILLPPKAAAPLRRKY